jgi:death-on-curing protein
MATFLMLNGIEIAATVDDQERLILDLAAGLYSREYMVTWLQGHTKKFDADTAI